MPGASPEASPTLHGRRRILVIGPGGAGKSTFSRQLGEITGLPVVHLDRYFWTPGWNARPRNEWNVLVAELTAEEEWIMDGNYGNSLAKRLERCDAVVFLDLSRLTCLWSVVKRRVAGARRARPDMAEQCPERLSAEFVRWIWRYPKASRPSILAALERAACRASVVTVTSRAEAARLLDALQRARRSTRSGH